MTRLLFLSVSIVFLLLSNCSYIQQRQDLKNVEKILVANGIDKSKADVAAERYGSGRVIGLRLEGYQIKTIPPIIGELTAVETIDLSYNEVTTLPSEIGKLVNLRVLNLVGGSFKYLPEEIGNCTKMEKLLLGTNEMDTLPWSIGKLTSLKELDLSDNKLRKLPGTLGNLQNVRKLLVQDNLISELPENMANIGCNELWLSHNKFTTYPIVVLRMRNLYHLAINGNPIDLKTVPKVIIELNPLHDYVENSDEIGRIDRSKLQ
jgi:Leucine-rich repeat (LRR) protein